MKRARILHWMHVAIVGAGPGGAALAYLLARRGVEVTLVERQKDFSREFRGEVLMPSGQDAFRQMGLEADFDALEQSRPRAVRAYLNGRLIGVLAAEVLSDFGLPPRIVSQPAMLEMLVERASTYPNFRLLRGVAVSDLAHERDRVIGLRLRGESSEVLRADLVVGADGRGSVVRRKSELALKAPDSESFDVVWFKIPMPPVSKAPAAGETPADEMVSVFLGQGHALLCFPSHDGRLQIAWLIDKGTFGSIRSRGADAWAAEMAEHAGPELGPHLRASIPKITHPFVLDVVCYLLPRWTAPGVMLLGDAAHPMSPVGGQGINIALRDALVAANHLIDAHEGTGDLDAASAAFEAERIPEARAIQRLQRIPPRFIFQRTWWARGALSLATRLAPVLPLVLRSGRTPPVLDDFAFGVTDVKLRV